MKHKYVPAASPRLARAGTTTASAASPVAATLMRRPLLRRPSCLRGFIPRRCDKSCHAAAVPPTCGIEGATEASDRYRQPTANELVQIMRHGRYDEERGCLAGASISRRAGPLEGQLAVAEVVLNRSASGEYPGSICEL